MISDFGSVNCSELITQQPGNSTLSNKYSLKCSCLPNTFDKFESADISDKRDFLSEKSALLCLSRFLFDNVFFLWQLSDHYWVEGGHFPGEIWISYSVRPFCISWSVMDGGFLPSFLPQVRFLCGSLPCLLKDKLLISPGWVGRLRAVTLNTNTHSCTHKPWQCCTTDRVCMSVYCMDSPSFRSLTKANIDTNTSHPISLLLGRTMTAMSVLTNLLKPHTHTDMGAKRCKICWNIVFTYQPPLTFWVFSIITWL